MRLNACILGSSDALMPVELEGLPGGLRIGWIRPRLPTGVNEVLFQGI